MADQVTIERMSSGDGHWFALELGDVERFIAMATETRQIYTVDGARRVERLDEAGIRALLASGAIVDYGSDWYQRLRQAPEPLSAERVAEWETMMTEQLADAAYCERRV